eukprot:s1179_g31.t1
MVLGPNAEWRDLAGRLALTAFTDNQTNAYVLDRFMSTAFPASVILMELALQLQEKQLELDLQWIPREQNVEADALTNEDFTGFSKDKRVEVDFQNLDFKVLHVLMGLAEEIDREIVLKRGEESPGLRCDPMKSDTSDLWDEVSSVQAELQQHHEMRRGRSAALNSQDEKLRSLRNELMTNRLQVQEALEKRHSAAARLEAAERGLESLQDAHRELKQTRQEHDVELRKLHVAASQALQAERARAQEVQNGSWARDGPEVDALKAAKVELAELLAEADEVRLRSRRESSQLAHQLEGAQAEHARLGGKMTAQEEVRTASPGRPRTVWRRLANARSEESNPFA